jgi:restriction system protein
MAGRGEKGVLITTGTFTAAAQQEATRDGVTPIDLLDGNELCDLLKRYSLGVTTEPSKTLRSTRSSGARFADRHARALAAEPAGCARR